MWTRAALRMFLAGSVIGCAGSAKQPAPNAPAIAAFPLEQRAGMRRVTVGLWKASFSPDGKRLVAGRLDRGLEVVELATGARTRITQFGKDPAWSPDGRLIAFVDGSGNAEQVWLVAAAGGEPRMVAKGGFPSWSGDGKLLYFSNRPQGHILSLAVDDPRALPQSFFKHLGHWYPAISSDGNKVGLALDGEVVVLERQTGVELAREAVAPGGGGFVTFSPDGNWVAYTFYGEPQGIGLFHLPTRQRRSVARGPFMVPTFSPDGRLLAFDMRLEGLNDVWVTDKYDLTPGPARKRGEAYGVLGVLRPGPGSVVRPLWRWRRKPLGEMGLRDLNGRVWKLADLKGKVAFVNLWASWCGPCREELPYVEKLHETLKGRQDTVVLSLNVDDEPDKARKYAAEHKLTIPVVLAADYVRKEIGPAISIPRSWIVGPDGMLTAEHKGFDPRQTEGWVAAAREEIERARH